MTTQAPHDAEGDLIPMYPQARAASKGDHPQLNLHDWTLEAAVLDAAEKNRPAFYRVGRIFTQASDCLPAIVYVFVQREGPCAFVASGYYEATGASLAAVADEQKMRFASERLRRLYLIEQRRGLLTRSRSMSHFLQAGTEKMDCIRVKNAASLEGSRLYFCAGDSLRSVEDTIANKLVEAIAKRIRGETNEMKGGDAQALACSVFQQLFEGDYGSDEAFLAPNIPAQVEDTLPGQVVLENVTSSTSGSHDLASMRPESTRQENQTPQLASERVA